MPRDLGCRIVDIDCWNLRGNAMSEISKERREYISQMANCTGSGTGSSALGLLREVLDALTTSEAEVARLTAELTEARKDSERLDWLERLPGVASIGGGWKEEVRTSAIVDVLCMDYDDGFSAKSVRAALDAARAPKVGSAA